MKQRTFLFVLLLLSTLTARSYDAEVGGIYYNFSGTKATVTSGKTKYTGSVTIPSTVTYDGVTYRVTSIGADAFEDCSGLTSVTIPNSVTSIGEYAFSECSDLTEVKIGGSVKEIGKRAFCDCSALIEVLIPNSVTYIGEYAFRRCYSLTSISVESGNTVYDSRENCNAIIRTATNTLLAGCKNTVIPNSVTSIEEGAFEDCKDLTSITIPNGVTSIGSAAFYGCI